MITVLTYGYVFEYDQSMRSEFPSAESSAACALRSLDRELDGLITVIEGGGLDHGDNHDLVMFMQDFERFRNRLSLVDHRVIREAEERHLAEFFTHGRLTDFMASALRISTAEAARRVKACLAVGERASMLGQPLAPMRPLLATAQRTGSVSPDQVSIIESALASVDLRGFDPCDIDAGEKLLTSFAAILGPKDLRFLANQVVDRIDPDGSRPKEEINEARRHFTMRQHADGTYVGEFRLTGATGSKLEAVLSPLSAPRSTTIVDTQGSPKVVPDDRPYVQRQHDALDDACSRLLRSGGLPDSGGTPATVIVRIDHADLLSQTGFGETSGGTQLSAAEVLRLAGEAEILPAVFAQSGALLDLGRSRRIATATQTMALIARDLGCSFPGCTHRPEWSERHHILAWALGGTTDLDNLTLLCGYHHRQFLEKGWVCRIGALGVPEWIPPRYIDREQRPLVNARIRRRLAAEELLRPPDDRAAA